MMLNKLMQIKVSPRKTKRFMAIFDNSTVHFGLQGGSTYIDHNDPKKRDGYIARHRVRENFEDPYTPGSLSRWILLGPHKSLSKNIEFFKKRFSL